MKKYILIFDFDGTIADTLDYAVMISNKLSTPFKYNKIRSNEVEKLKKNTLLQNIKYLKVPIVKVPLIVVKARHELNNYVTSIKPIVDLKDILLELKSMGHLMGIVTSNSSKTVRDFLKNHEINIFDFISSSSSIWGKNYRLKKVIKKNKLSLNKIIYIGDETRDIEAAKKVGIKSAAVTWGFNAGDVLKTCNPDFLLNKPKDLLKLAI